MRRLTITPENIFIGVIQEITERSESKRDNLKHSASKRHQNIFTSLDIMKSGNYRFFCNVIWVSGYCHTSVVFRYCTKLWCSNSGVIQILRKQFLTPVFTQFLSSPPCLRMTFCTSIFAYMLTLQTWSCSQVTRWLSSL